MLRGTCHCGAAGWTLAGDPGPITACNCTLCHRYGALWAYDFEGERVAVTGKTASFRRPGKTDPALEIVFCPSCAGVLAWRGLRLDEDGRRRMAVNVRLSSVDKVGHLPIDHFDGLDTFDDLPSDGKTVRDLWF
ncbi:GFA family protein [Sphingomonas sp.]|uniref:GFA family protein n=1 Tax=Sphingomonas sp. TaxID=28214 RepID=UPI003FA72B2D